MLYIYPIPVILIASILYIVSKQWDLKLFALISKILVIAGIIFFIITYASFLGYDIPFVSHYDSLISHIYKPRQQELPTLIPTLK